MAFGGLERDQVVEQGRAKITAGDPLLFLGGFAGGQIGIFGVFGRGWRWRWGQRYRKREQVCNPVQSLLYFAPVTT